MNNLLKLFIKGIKWLLGIILGFIVLFIMIGLLGYNKAQITSQYKGSILNIQGLHVRYLDSCQNKLCTTEEEKPVILLLHGSPGSIEDWQAFIPVMVSRGYRVIAIDRPGHGFSEATNISSSLQGNADFIYRLIQRLALKRVILVGHSYGGSVTLNLAVQNPQEIKSYVIIGAPSYHYKNTQHLLNIFAIPVLGRGVFRFLTTLVDQKSMLEKWQMKALHPNEQKVSKELMKKRVALWIQTRAGISMAKEISGLEKDIQNISPLYSKIESPFCIVVGKNDNPSYIKDAKRLVHTIKGAKIFLFPKTGHYVQFAHPIKLTEIIIHCGQ